MSVTAEVELIAINDRTLRFKIACRDEKDPIGEGFHERTIVDNARFLARLALKTGG
jgi:fluoroacetyl-CoA thioesterase